MKNLFLTTICFFLFFCGITAQNSSFIIGINGGSNLSKFKNTGDFAFNSDVEEKRKLGFQGGLDIGLKFNNFSILTGVHYKQNNGKAEWLNTDVTNPFVLDNGTTDTGRFLVETELNQISIPILLRYSSKGNLAFTISIGPVVNLRVGKSTNLQTLELDNLANPSPITETNTFGDTPNDSFSKSNVGFVFSPGVIYKVSDNGFFRLNFNYLANGDIVNDSFGLQDNLGSAVKFVILKFALSRKLAS